MKFIQAVYSRDGRQARLPSRYHRPMAMGTGRAAASASSGLVVGLVVAVVTFSPGCKFGLDYSGDERGLRRDSIPVEGHEGRSLSYLIDEVPGAPRVIFIHGSPGQSGMYADYLRSPVAGVETIAVDRLGYGDSRPLEPVVSFEEQAAAIAPLLVERDGLWPIVVGHSLGGPIASRLAADYPDKVGGLIVVAGGLNPELEDVRWYNRVARWRIVYPFLAGFLRVSNKEMWACREQVELLEPRLDDIECPIVIIHGTGDSLVPFETVEFSVERFRDREHIYVIVLIGEGHSVTSMRKEEVRETIEELRDGLVNLMELQQ